MMRNSAVKKFVVLACLSIWQIQALAQTLSPSLMAKFFSNVKASDFTNCNGTNDNTADFTTMSALAPVNIYIDDGLTCVINAPTLLSHTHIIGGPNSRLLKLAGSTTTYLITTSFKTDMLFQNLILDGNSVVQSTSNTYSTFISGGDVTFDNVTLQNSGSPSTAMGGIDIFNGSATFKNSTVATSVLGNQFTSNFNNNFANRVLVLNSKFHGSQAKAIWFQNSGSQGFCNGEIAGDYIDGVLDSAGDAGQSGNAISAFNCTYTHIHHNTTNGTRYSGIRLTNSSFMHVDHNTLLGAQETALYCTELGGSGNLCDHNTIKDSASGINMTNVSNRSPDARNVADSNYLTNIAYYGIYAEHDIVTNNVADGIPFPFIFGHGVTSHDNIGTGNSCAQSSTSYYPVVVCESIDIGMTGLSYIYNNFSNGSIAPTIATRAASNMPSNLVITGITKASSAIVTTSSSLPASGAKVCFGQISGMLEINGICGLVSSPSGSTFTVAIDSTGFSTFVATPTGGTAPAGQGVVTNAPGGAAQNTYANNIVSPGLPVTVAFSATPVFNVRVDPVITLTGNVTSSTIANLVAGTQVTFTICQDATGSRTFVAPTALKGFTTIGATASKCSVQTFKSPDGTNLYATGAGVINQ